MADSPKPQRSEAKLTPEVRVAFPFVHERRTKRANGTPLDKPRYDMVVLLPKLHGDPAQCANYMLLHGMCVEAARKMWPGSVDQTGRWVWPQGLAPRIMDGDVPYQAKAPAPGQPAKQVDPNAYAWRRGCWQIEVDTKFEPGPKVCVMQNGQAIEVPAKVVAGRQVYKSGDYAFVSMHAYAWQHESGKFGVSFGFEGVLFTREGEAIGSAGPRSASSMFGGVAQVASPTMPGQVAGTVAAPPPNVGAGQAPGYAPPPVAQGYAQPGPLTGAPLPPQPTAAYAPPLAPAAPYSPAAPQGYAPPPMPPAAPAAYAGAPGLPPMPPLPR